MLRELQDRCRAKYCGTKRMEPAARSGSCALMLPQSSTLLVLSLDCSVFRVVPRALSLARAHRSASPSRC